VQEDLRIPRSMVQNIVWTCLNRVVEPALNCWPFSRLREKALKDLMNHIRYEDETTEYVGACPVNKVMHAALV
jgi:achilleol B synthase